MLIRTAHRGFRQFNAGDPFLACNYGRRGKWERRVVTKVLGSRHYMVKVAGVEASQRPTLEIPCRCGLDA